MQHAASFERGDQHVFQPGAADVDVAVRDGGLNVGNAQCSRYNSAKSVKHLQKSFRMRKMRKTSYLDGGREQIQKRQNLGQSFVFVGGVGYPVQL
jgi:hypothetical protein